MSEEAEHSLEPSPQGQRQEKSPIDFFVSYTGADSVWAEWIAFELERVGYTTIIQAWDSRPGMNFVGMMHEASMRSTRTIVVLSTAYLRSEFGFAEWAVAFRGDPKGKQGKLVPIRIEACEVEGLLGPIVYIDLVGQDEEKARETLLAGVKRERAKPSQVAFPTSASSQKSGPLTLDRSSFPGSLPPIWTVPYPRNALFTDREERTRTTKEEQERIHAIEQQDSSDGKPRPLFQVESGEETLRRVLSLETKARLRHLMPFLDEEA